MNAPIIRADFCITSMPFLNPSRAFKPPSLAIRLPVGKRCSGERIRPITRSIWKPGQRLRHYFVERLDDQPAPPEDHLPDTLKSHYDVVIIGAGLAGLSL